MSTTAGAWLQCTACGARYDLQPLFFGCRACALQGQERSLELVYDMAPLWDWTSTLTGAGAVGRLWDYAAVLPPHETAARTTLGEG